MTKLEAVADVMRRAGLMPPSFLDTGGVSVVAQAERIIDRVDVEIMSLEWHFNSRVDIELEPVLYEIAGATWTDATKTITKSGEFVDATVGQTLSVSGTGVTSGDVIVTGVDSTSGNYVTVDTDISSGGDLGAVVAVTATNNRLAVPAGAIIIDADENEESIDLTQIGGRLYDRGNNTGMFSQPVKVRYDLRYAFECTPLPLQKYIVLTAAKEFCTSYCNDPKRQGMLMRNIYDDLGRAEAEARKWDLNMRDTNVLESPDMIAVRGGRSRGVLGVGRFRRSESPW